MRKLKRKRRGEESEEEGKKKVENAKRESLCRDIVCFSYFVK